MRTVPKHEDDIWPIVSVWLPTSLIAYLITYKITEFILNQYGLDGMMPVEMCGGGQCNIISMTVSRYYAGFVGISVLLVVLWLWYVHGVLLRNTHNTHTN